MIEIRVTAATTPLIDLVRVRSHLNIVDDEEDDATLEFYLAAAVARGEGITRRAFGTEVWSFYYPCFYDPMPIGRGKCQAVTGIEYGDSDGATQTLAPAVYRANVANDVAPTLTRNQDQTWPDTDPQVHPETVKVTATVGYTELPFDLQQAVLFTLAHFYENREEVIAGTTASVVPEAARYIFNNYTIPAFA